ncbi:hypothetical protein [Paraflavitalea sp. CAU 1676]|uniref:hypothetical protein n=1 Tax=Paraflavitalea sp. CAU 1676 TaxID=3032598 RepID=UPI0023D9C2B4|nr:hypothetical protein [Paraflavitalea sp. CAU 1676]MDF2192361.1 hypothetical protein [Paraflavitalea sp. CAU 1676]
MKAIVINLKEKQEVTLQEAGREEFGRLCEATGLIHTCLRPVIYEDTKALNRGALVKQLARIQKTDMHNNYGERTVENGDLTLLEGHELGGRKSVHQVSYMKFEGDINGSTGICWVKVPALRPLIDLHTERAATHVRFVACAASFDFARKTFERNVVYSNYLSLDEEHPEINLPVMVKVLDGKPLLLFFGLGFYQCVNGRYHLSLSNGGMMLQCLKTARGEAEPS